MFRAADVLKSWARQLFPVVVVRIEAFFFQRSWTAPWHILERPTQPSPLARSLGRLLTAFWSRRRRRPSLR